MFRTHSAVGERRTEAFPFALDTRASNLDTGYFEGYAAAFNVLIPGLMEMVDPGAFTRTLQERGDRVKVLWQHDQSDPIGLPTKMAEDTYGLRVGAQLADTPKIRGEYLPLIKPGDDGRAVIDRMSIGFTIVQDKIDPATGIWHLLDVELYEFSLVTFPANEGATVNSVRSRNVLDQAKRALGIADATRKLSAADAQYGMAILMGARGAGSFADLDEPDRASLYSRLSDVYTEHGLTPPLYTGGPVSYSAVEFHHDETTVYTARSLCKRLSDVTSAARHAARQGVPIDSEIVQEATAALDAIRAMGLEDVTEQIDRLTRAREAASTLGITIATAAAA